jgi:hypothetical protein
MQNHGSRNLYFRCIDYGKGHCIEACPETKENFKRIQEQKRMMQAMPAPPKPVHHTI